ncbi:MAG: hypothetical protein JW795_12940 [Chitinivibrionales bacterium]|nr:hypothetical protein [Chitinivibrionales bacterium]
MRPLSFFLIRIYIEAMSIIGAGLGILQKPTCLKQDNQKKNISLLLNRSDRIGDAIVTLPLIRAIDASYSVTVVSSQYNEDIFKRAGIQTIAIEQIPSYFRDTTWTSWLKQRLFWSVRKKVASSHNADDPYDAYINFIGTPEAEIQLSFSYRYSIGFAFGFYGLNYDRRVSRGRRTSYTQLFINMIREIIPEYRFTASTHDLDLLIERSPEFELIVTGADFQLIHIGAKETRRVADQELVELLNQMTLTTLVIDDPGGVNMQRLKPLLNNRALILIEKGYSLFQLLSLTSHKRCRLFIGFDSGSSHFLQLPTNSLILYTVTDHRAWRPYTSASWQLHHVSKRVRFETSICQDTIKCIAYRTMWCRPCYDIGCRKQLCKKFPLIDIYRSVFSRLPQQRL